MFEIIELMDTSQNDQVMIPTEAIEAAARAMSPAAWGPSVWQFAAHGESPADARNRVQQESLEDARRALEAAAPYMLAEAADDALRAAWDRGYATATDGMKDVPAVAWDEGFEYGVGREAYDIDNNPYRPARG